MLKRLIERPIAVTMFLIIAIILGVVSINLLPVSLIPAVDIPYITVQVSNPGQSAGELDASVMSSLRGQLMQVTGVNDIYSETKDGSGTITLSFEHGMNTDYLFIEINEKIDRAMHGMPSDMERPKVLKAGATDIPSFYINLTIKDDDNYLPPSDLYPVSDRFAELSDFTQSVIVRRLEQLPQIAMVDVSGYVSPELLIIPDQARLDQSGIPLSTLESAIRNIDISLGSFSIRDGEYQYTVKVQQTATSKKSIEDAYLKIGDRIFQVKELAQVIEHPRKRDCIIKSNDKNAISLAVIKQSEARMSQLQESVGELVEILQKEYPDIEFTNTRDQTQLLDYSINNLIQNILVSIVLVSLILLFFMQNIRTALLVVMTIPIALILSMLLFYIIGLTINIVSLSGLILGVGMMVDNSIIVIDNITFRWNSGFKLKDAVVTGTSEVFTPMLSSVLTTCAVFVPLIFMSGIAGSIFYDQAMAVVITLFSSLAATVTVIPVYYYLMYRRQEKMRANKFLEKFSFDKVIKVYEKILKRLFRRRIAITVSMIIAFAGIFVLFGIIKKERLPEITYTDMLLNIDWNDRLALEESSRRSGLVIDHISEYTEQVTEMTGVQQFLLGHTRQTGLAESIIYVKAKEGVGVDKIVQEAGEFIRSSYPNAIYWTESSGNIFEKVFADKEAKLVARIKQTNRNNTEKTVLDNLFDDIETHLDGSEIQPLAWEEHILYVAKPEVMAIYGISFSQLMSTLRNSFNENKILTITQGKESVPVIVGKNSKSVAEMLENSTVKLQDKDVPISMFFMETRKENMKTIISGPEGNFIPINIEAPDRDIPVLIDSIRNDVRKYDEFDVTFSGSYFSNKKMIGELAIILIVAVMLLYFILASQFESTIQPFIILSELVIDIFAMLFTLWVFGLSLNIMAMIGLIVTCGIVINDSILKIDTINQLRRQGVSLIRAIIVGGQRRLKAIIMTSLTTILAAAPFLSRGDMGSDLQYPFSIALISGMVVGTLISIFYVPLIYFSIYKKKKK